MPRILLIEDNPRLATMLARALSQAGIEADSFDTIARADEALALHDYAALILDRGLPDGDGLELVRRMRADRIALPCLMLTARDAIHDRIEGLNSGADDYLTKPFSVEELVARVQALLRRSPVVRTLEPAFADLSLKTGRALLACGASAATLPPAELQIMLALLQAGGAIVSRRKLEQAGWGLGESVTPNALDVALHRLRRKLEQIGSQVTIQNVRSQGYALTLS